MQFTLRVTRKKDGQYRAFCAELGLSVYDSDPETAISRLQSLIFENFLGNVIDFPEDISGNFNVTNGIKLPEYIILKSENKIKTFYFPRHTNVH